MDAGKKMIYKLLVIIGLLMILVIFTLQSMQQVSVRLFFWIIYMSTALVILLPLAVELLIGWLGIPPMVVVKRGNLLEKEEK